MHLDQTFGFIGAGHMASALIHGLVQRKVVVANQIIASDPDPDRLSALREELHVRTASENRAAIHAADCVVLAIKPQVFDAVLPEVAVAIDPATLVISIAAGVTTQRIEAALPAGTRVIRSMPNTPALVAAGATAIAAGTHATARDQDLAEALFESVGIVARVPEHQMDAVTGLSGSGPAYVFAMIECLRDAGAAVGLPADTAEELAAQTVFGAARLLLERGLRPETLREQVTSPGGTTLAGLRALESGGFAEAVANAVRAATKRSTELDRGD